MDGITLIYTFSIFVLVLMSAFFSGSETGITASSKGKIHRLSKEGNKRAKKTEKLLKNKERLIGTILLGNNTVNILASAIATSLFIKHFGEAGVAYATIVMTLLILVFSEITPKTWAIQNAEKAALISAPLLAILVKIFYPITKRIQTLVSLIINPSNKKQQPLISELDEIRGAIELKHKEGSMFKDDKDMISNILDLGEIEISNVVVHRKNIKSINIEQTLNSIIKQALNINYTRIPLWKNDKDNIVAILDVKKLIRQLHKNNNKIEKIKLESITSKPWFVPATNSLKNQLSDFRNKKKKLAIVIDEYSALVGIITLEDILEEIVGSMADKEENEIQQIVKISNGCYKIFGELPIRDINRKLNWNLPEDEEDVSTLAGLVIAKIKRIPDEKEKIKLNNFIFTIVKKKHNKIILLKVKKQPLT